MNTRPLVTSCVTLQVLKLQNKVEPGWEMTANADELTLHPEALITSQLGPKLLSDRRSLLAAEFLQSHTRKS